MLKMNPQKTRPATRLKSKTILLIWIAVLMTSSFSFAKAEEVNFSVQVLPRKVTDTINDFDFSSLLSPQVSPQVKGVSTVKVKPGKILLWTRIINWFKRTF